MRNSSNRSVVSRWIAVSGLVSALLTTSIHCMAESAEQANPAVQLATPTHHQTGLIQTNVAGLPDRALQCFCLTPDNRIVAGLAGGAGELRVFDDQGGFVESWTAPFAPEAIFIRGDGKIFLAGEGQVARLSSAGEVELQRKAPHVDAMSQDVDKIRQEVVAQNKNRAEVYVEQSKQYDQMLEQADKQIDRVKDQLAALEKPADKTGEQVAQRKRRSNGNSPCSSR